MTAASSIIIEVCVDSVQSAISAAKGGADRLELCANLSSGGGTTPSIGLLKAVKRATDLPIMAMVRPRIGDFLYSEYEMEVILEDIRRFKEQNVRGIVAGVLTRDGQVDAERMKQIVDEALPLEVCFHRAFDMTRDPQKSLRDLENIGGISRILTSGHGRNVVDNLSTIESLLRIAKELVQDDPWGLTILPGSGINPANVGTIVDTLLPQGLREIHLSGGRWVPGEVIFRREGMGMGIGGQGEWGIWLTDEDVIRRVRGVVDKHWEEFVDTNSQSH